jgi:hypothetical protein
MKHAWLFALPFLALACTGEVTDDRADEAQSSLKSKSKKKKKKKKKKPVPVCQNGALPGTMPGCAPGYTVACEFDKYPYCCVCEEEPPTLSCANVLCAEGHECIETKTGPECVPTLSCANVLCQAGHSCEIDCSGNPVCLPDVCEGFAGLSCPDDFNCIKKSKAPDQGGKCVKDCAPSCGECVSDGDCSKGESCTASQECLSSCDCPSCDVCAGHCVPEEK